jgi:hypothetical protein
MFQLCVRLNETMQDIKVAGIAELWITKLTNTGTFPVLSHALSPHNSLDWFKIWT